MVRSQPPAEDLDAVVAAVAHDVGIAGGHPRIEDDALAAHAAAIDALPAARKARVGEELVALALKAGAAEGFDVVVGQLAVLAAVAVGDTASVALFDAAAPHTTGSTRPVGTDRIPGATTPLGARLHAAGKKGTDP